MKLFDIVGGLAVATWIILSGLHVYRAEFQSVQETAQLDSELVMKEGETWLTLRRESEDVGFAHQTRTRIQDGWLLEYDLVMAVSLLGSQRAIETRVKATLDNDGLLEKFSADVTAGDNTFSAQGHVDGKELTLNIDLGLNPRQRTIQLEDAPRLSSSAFNQLLATDSLQDGETFEESYFDPTTMQMTTMTLEYVGRDTVDLIDQKVEAHHIKQRVSGNELDVYVNDDGEILIQEFPLKMIGMKVPAELGKTRASALRRKLDAMEKEKKKKPRKGMDLSVDTALDLLGGTAETDELADDASTPTMYRLEGHTDELELTLDSGRQAFDGDDTIRTNQAGSDATSLGENERVEYVEPGPRVDSDAPSFEPLVADLPEATRSAADAIAERVQSRLEVAGEAGISTASAALETGRGDCTEHALVLVAALRSADIPARFASGVLYEDGKMTPHQWVQYHDGDRWVDVDITRENREPTPRHIQMYTHIQPEHTAYIHALDQLTLTPTDDADKTQTPNKDTPRPHETNTDASDSTE